MGLGVPQRRSVCTVYTHNLQPGYVGALDSCGQIHSTHASQHDGLEAGVWRQQPPAQQAQHARRTSESLQGHTWALGVSRGGC